jgi:phage-related protein
MKYGRYYYQDRDGLEPVRDYIRGLSVSERAKTYAFMRHLGDHGPQTTRPAADCLGDKTGLYELRPKPHRYLYFYYHRNKIVSLHAFEKDTRVIPEKAIKIAMERKAQMILFGKASKLEFEEEANDET